MWPNEVVEHCLDIVLTCIHSFKKYLLLTIIKIKEDRGCQGRERSVRCWAE